MSVISRNIHSYGTLSVGKNCRIDDGCIFTGNVEIGDYVHVGPYCVFHGGGGIKVGDYSGFSGGCMIYTTSDDFSGNFLFGPNLPDDVRNVKTVPLEIGRYVIFGARSTVITVNHIPDGVAIGAHALLMKEPKAWSIYAGNPARKIKERSSRCVALSETL